MGGKEQEIGELTLVEVGLLSAPVCLRREPARTTRPMPFFLTVEDVKKCARMSGREQGIGEIKLVEVRLLSTDSAHDLA